MLRRLFWVALSIGLYIFIVTMEQEHWVYRKAMVVYDYCEKYMEDVEFDWNIH